MKKYVLPIFSTVGMSASTKNTNLDNLPKCAHHEYLTLLQTTPTKRTRRPRWKNLKYPCTTSVTCHIHVSPYKTSNFARIQQQFNPLNLHQLVSKPSCDTILFWLVSFPQMPNTSYSQACFHEVQTLITSI
jgi:hypothetical protein